jgi:hypothetical protein
MKVYIAGPMRNYPRYNFDAFYEAEHVLSGLGHVAFNPARVDEKMGFNPDVDSVTVEMVEEFVRRDVELLIGSDAIFLLQGWEQSHGAQAEFHIARWLGKRIYYDRCEIPKAYA